MGISRKKITLKTLKTMKTEMTKASFITCYDYPSAAFAEEAEIDMILVGDSGGMTTLGYKNTMPVTMDEMLHFAKAVCRAVKYAFVVGDMPFLSYQVSDQSAIRNAGRFMAEAGCDAIKLEGGAKMASRIKAISTAGIPVMAHLGLTPQSVSLAGGYRVYGKTVQEVDDLVYDALIAMKSGASFILLEAIPEECAAIIRDQVDIPVYGIGAGKKLDGQLLILHDVIGAFVGDVKPKFAKQYADVKSVIVKALNSFKYDINQQFFPDSSHLYSIDEEELKKIQSRYGNILSSEPEAIVPSSRLVD